MLRVLIVSVRETPKSLAKLKLLKICYPSVVNSGREVRGYRALPLTAP